MPDLLTEREEVELRSLAAAALRQVGQEQYNALVDQMLLAHKAEILSAPENNPARIRLLQLLELCGE